MGLIARESIEEVRRANDIVDLISGYLPLKKRGVSYWANCPFHDEKTPSFSVSSPRQTYKCFGCGEFGNVIDFVMKHEKLDFREAAEKLALRGGVTLNYEGGGPSVAERSLRQKALEIMSWAQRGFESHLSRSPAAQEYLNKRGLGGEVAASWGIGFAPDERTRVTDAARSKFEDEALLATGICRKNDDGRWYDFFRGRVTFPIHDAQGRIVGFGARLLDPDAKAQKYVNSAEGLLFHKSELLFAMDRLANSRRLKETDSLLVMEGYTDVILAHALGFDNAVAPLGTSLTEQHVAKIRQRATHAILVLDGDEAGQKGSERALDVLLLAGGVRAGSMLNTSQVLRTSVVVVPELMDPFDFLQAHGAEGFEQLLATPVDAFDFKVSLVRSRHDLSTAAGKESCVHELAAFVAKFHTEVSRAARGARVSALVGVDERRIAGAVSEAHRALSQQRGHDVKSLESGTRTANKSAHISPRDAAGAQHERELLRRLLEHSSVLRAAAEVVTPEDFRTPALGEVYREMLNAVDEHGQAVPGALLSHLGVEARAELDRVIALMGVPANLSAGTEPEEAAELLSELKRFADDRRRQEERAPRGSAEELAQLRQNAKRRKAS